MNNYTEAMMTWKLILGSENVLNSPEVLKSAETATFQTAQKIPLIIRPGNREEVQSSLKIANDFGTPVYPLSTGKNWGLGSRVPVKDAVIMDLSRMNGILDYNEELAYVTIEPGVSCRQLYHFLREKKSRLMVSLTGSTPDASVIGNVMERGHSKGQYADRYANVCGFEVVLPTGECLNSGFERFDGAKAGKVNRWGVGPVLEGLFSQSNLGVVTKLTLWLQPFPEVLQTVFFSVSDEAKLPELIDTLRDLRLSGAIRSSVSLLNDYRVQSELGQYPWERMNNKSPLSPEILRTMKAINTGMETWDGVWNGETALYSLSAAHADADEAHLRKVLGPKVDKIIFHRQNLSSMADLLEQATDPESGNIDRQKVTYTECRMLGFMGIPLAGSVPITYWKKRTPTPASDLNPDRDGCGIIWCSPTVPFNGKDIEAASEIISRTMREFGFEPNLCLNGVTDRSIDITAAILFDRDIDGEDRKAIQCYNKMLGRLCTEGYIPYRLTIHSMDALLEEKGDHTAVLRKIKRVLDPVNILAPGRYE
jgi:4-cresol dehydrogenase (hydroxylating) flavoprotein subunit